MTETEWLSPWYGVDDPVQCAGLEKQLAQEISPRHVLQGLACRLIARRDDLDEALFALPDGRVAEVHLTWRQTRETEPQWPITGLYASLDEWRELSMIPLANELRELER